VKSDNLWIEAVLGVAAIVLLAVLYVFSRRARRAARTNGNGKEDGNGKGPPGFYPTLIRQAGFRSGAGLVFLWAAKLLTAALVPLLASEIVGDLAYKSVSTRVVALLAVVGFFLPDLWLLRERARRRRRVRQALSYFLDLVVSLLYSGLTLERAFLRAARDGFTESNPLADEVLILGRELEMGKDRATAFAELAYRTGVTELRAVAAAVQMGLRLGAPIRETLEAQAELMRTKRRELALRQISMASVVSILPVFLSGIPLYAVVVYFPAFLQVMETLHNLRPF
jgi:tight adherence protein C